MLLFHSFLLYIKLGLSQVYPFTFYIATSTWFISYHLPGSAVVVTDIMSNYVFADTVFSKTFACFDGVTGTLKLMFVSFSTTAISHFCSFACFRPDPVWHSTTINFQKLVPVSLLMI